jgi:hypothetical protein
MPKIIGNTQFLRHYPQRLCPIVFNSMGDHWLTFAPRVKTLEGVVDPLGESIDAVASTSDHRVGALDLWNF